MEDITCLCVFLLRKGEKKKMVEINKNASDDGDVCVHPIQSTAI